MEKKKVCGRFLKMVFQMEIYKNYIQKISTYSKQIEYIDNISTLFSCFSFVVFFPNGDI